jgi:hypothetical protein
MQLIHRRAEFVRRKVELLRVEQADNFAAGDDQIDVFPLLELCTDAAEIYDDICRLDEHWHLWVYRQPDSYDESVAKSLQGLFRNWFDICLRLLERIELRQQLIDGEQDVIVRLRADADQCRALLNPADAETALADEALTLHRSGLTEST